MTQQTFANFIGINAASLSSIFNDRTRPTLNTVEAIKSKIPNLNTDWLMFGHGQMFNDTKGGSDVQANDDGTAGGMPPRLACFLNARLVRRRRRHRCFASAAKGICRPDEARNKVCGASAAANHRNTGVLRRPHLRELCAQEMTGCVTAVIMPFCKRPPFRLRKVAF